MRYGRRGKKKETGEMASDGRGNVGGGVWRGGVRWLAAVVGAALLPGCASEMAEGPAGLARWVPSAQPAFASLARSTTYALVHAPDRDLLVIESPVLNEAGDAVTARLTWLVTVPSDAALGAMLEVGDEGARAWVLEELERAQSHVAAARGTVSVEEREPEAIVATVTLEADGAAPTAGVVERAKVSLTGRYRFERYVPTTPQYREMSTRRGIDPGTSGKR